VVAKAQAVLSEPELLRAMFDGRLLPAEHAAGRMSGAEAAGFHPARARPKSHKSPVGAPKYLDIISILSDKAALGA
jgi:hypothetical protein